MTKKKYMCRVQCLVPNETFLLNGIYWDKLVFFLHFYKGVLFDTRSQAEGKKSFNCILFFQKSEYAKKYFIPFRFFFFPITNLFRALIKAYLFCFNLTQSKQFEAIYSDEEGASINLLGWDIWYAWVTI